MVRHGALEVTQIPAGPIETNAYVVFDPESKEALIVDAPPDALESLEIALNAQGATPIGLVLTHTHWDHTGDAAAVVERWGVPLMVHELERERIEHPAPGQYSVPAATADRLLADGDTVELGAHQFAVMHTPGHSPGQVSLYSAPDALMFGGDTLFPNGYGRVDIPGASEADTLSTLRRLLTLPDDVVVYTGHGLPTTIGKERGWMEQVVKLGRLL